MSESTIEPLPDRAADGGADSRAGGGADASR